MLSQRAGIVWVWGWGDPLRLGLTCHHRGSVPGKGSSLSQWRALQSGYGSVLTAIWLEILLSSSCCGDVLAELHLGLVAVKEYVSRLPWDSYTLMWQNDFKSMNQDLKLHWAILFILTIDQIVMSDVTGDGHCQNYKPESSTVPVKSV